MSDPACIRCVDGAVYKKSLPHTLFLPSSALSSILDKMFFDVFIPFFSPLPAPPVAPSFSLLYLSVADDIYFRVQIL